MYGDKSDDTHFATHDNDFVVIYSASTKRELLTITSEPEKYCIKMSLLSPEEQKREIDNAIVRHKQSEDITVVSVKL